MDQPRNMPMVPPTVATRVGRSRSGLCSSVVTSRVVKYTKTVSLPRDGSADDSICIEISWMT